MSALPHTEDVAAVAAEEEESRLFRMKGSPPPPARTLRAKEDARAQRELSTVARTSTGESAQDITGAWVTWYESGAGVPLPKQIVSRMAAEVKSCIQSGYTTNEIKLALAYWIAQQMHQEQLSPKVLSTYAWRIARDTRAGAGERSRRMQAEIKAFCDAAGVSSGGSKSQQRRSTTLAAAERWAERP